MNNHDSDEERKRRREELDKYVTIRDCHSIVIKFEKRMTRVEVLVSLQILLLVATLVSLLRSFI